MATDRRMQRLGSLLREVVTEVIRSEVRHPDVASFTSITEVKISKDLRHAKVHVSVLGTPEQKSKTVKALQEASGFIGRNAASRVRLRYFPELVFKLDDAVEAQMHIQSLLDEIEEERQGRDDGGDSSDRQTEGSE